jgi:hypothetical protein
MRRGSAGPDHFRYWPPQVFRSESSSLPWLCFLSRFQRLPLRVRILLEDAVIHLERAFHSGEVHRFCVSGLVWILDDERAAGEHVLPRDLVPVLVFRVVKFPEESRAQGTGPKT